MNKMRRDSVLADTVAVTGATGMVGVRLVRQLLRAGYTVQAIVRSYPAAGHPIYHTNVSISMMDLVAATEQEIMDWLTIARPIALIHCAAMTDVEGCDQRSTLAYRMNARVPWLLARACAQQHVHFVLASTDYVFDGSYQAGHLYAEDDPVHALNHYGNSKLLGEIAVQEACGMKTVWTICRTSVVYGTTPWTRHDIPTWLSMKLRRSEVVYGASDQINSPTYASDLARMLVAVVQERLPGVYHTSGRTPASRYQLLLSIARACGLDESLIQPKLTSELGQAIHRPLNVGLSIEKISRHLGKQPMSLEEGLAAWRMPERAVHLSNDSVDELLC